MREKTAMMARVKNEGRWIRRCLERTFRLCKTIVIFDDGSTDNTEEECMAALGPYDERTTECGVIYRGDDRELHFIDSPFVLMAREKERVNEIRDKNFLWYYMKANVEFRHVLCLDGDEMPSLQMIREWPTAIKYLETKADIVVIPFVYLWGSEEKMRVDGVYGNAADGIAKLRFPRLFTIDRITSAQLFDTKFAWFGTKGGFHCGSVPMEAFKPGGNDPARQLFHAPIIHFGYIDDDLRRRKFEFYNKIDPNNKTEGGYKHIIEEPNHLAPGPVQFKAWRDA